MTALPLLVVTSVFLTVHTYDDPEEVARVCKIPTALGCSVSRGNACTMHVLQPQIGRDIDFVVAGHELWHCMIGDFH